MQVISVGAIKVNPFNLEGMAGSLGPVAHEYDAAARTLTSAAGNVGNASGHPAVDQAIQSAIRALGASMLSLHSAVDSTKSALLNAATSYTGADGDAASVMVATTGKS